MEGRGLAKLELPISRGIRWRISPTRAARTVRRELGIRQLESGATKTREEARRDRERLGLIKL